MVNLHVSVHFDCLIDSSSAIAVWIVLLRVVQVDYVNSVHKVIYFFWTAAVTSCFGLVLAAHDMKLKLGQADSDRPARLSLKMEAVRVFWAKEIFIVEMIHDIFQRLREVVEMF